MPCEAIEGINAEDDSSESSIRRPPSRAGIGAVSTGGSSGSRDPQPRLNRGIAAGTRAIATITTDGTPSGRGILSQTPPASDRPSSTRIDAAHPEVETTGHHASTQVASTPLLLDELQHDRARMAATPRVQAPAPRNKHNMAPTSPTMLRELLHLEQSNF